MDNRRAGRRARTRRRRAVGCRSIAAGPDTARRSQANGSRRSLRSPRRSCRGKRLRPRPAAPAEASAAVARPAGPGLGSRRSAWVRDRGRRRHGSRYRSLLHTRREPRLDRRSCADRPRRGRIGPCGRRGARAAEAVRPIPVRACCGRRRHRRRVRDPRGGVGPLRPRSRRSRAAARRRHCRGRNRDCSPLARADHRRHRARRRGARAGAAGDRHRLDVALGGLRADRARGDGRSRCGACLGSAARRDQRRRERPGGRSRGGRGDVARSGDDGGCRRPRCDAACDRDRPPACAAGDRARPACALLCACRLRRRDAAHADPVRGPRRARHRAVRLRRSVRPRHGRTRLAAPAGARPRRRHVRARARGGSDRVSADRRGARGRVVGGVHRPRRTGVALPGRAAPAPLARLRRARHPLGARVPG